MSTRPHRSCREKSKKWFQGDSGEEEDEEEKVDPKEEVPSQNIEGKDINHDQEESQQDTTRKVTKQRKASKRRRTNHVTEEDDAVLLHAKKEIEHLKILSPSDTELTSKFIYQTVDQFDPVVLEKKKASITRKPVGFRGLECKNCNTSYFYKNSVNYHNLASHYLNCEGVTKKVLKERQAIKDKDKKTKRRKSDQDQMSSAHFYRMIFCRLHEVEDENEITDILENDIGMKPKEIITSDKPKRKRRKVEKEIEVAQDESPKKKGRKIKKQEVTNEDKSTKAKGKRGRKQKAESTKEEEIETALVIPKKKQKRGRKGEKSNEIQHMEEEKPKKKRGRPKKEKPDPKGIQETIIVPTILNKLDFRSLTLPTIEEMYNNEQGLFGIIEEDEFCQYNVKFGSNSLIVLKTLGLSLYGDIDDKINNMIAEEGK